jgi:hypothetical protein
MRILAVREAGIILRPVGFLAALLVLVEVWEADSLPEYVVATATAEFCIHE